MPIIQWSEKFSTSNPEIDTQHKEWLAIYNKAHDRMMGSNDTDFKSTGIDALGAMKDYSQYHFTKEEEWMSSIGFPGLEQHIELHRAFTLKIEGMIQDLHKGNHVLNSEIIKRIENWLTQHILNEDQKIKEYTEQGKTG